MRGPAMRIEFVLLYSHHSLSVDRQPIDPSNATPCIRPSLPRCSLQPHLLIASDDDPVRKLLTTVLTRAGYRITAARNGVAAVAALLADKSDFDLALLDGQLPPISGAHVISVIRTAGCQVPVLLASGSFVAGDLPTDSKVAFLSKPFTVETLLQTVSVLLLSPRG